MAKPENQIHFIKTATDKNLVIEVNGKTYIESKVLGKGSHGKVIEMVQCSWQDGRAENINYDDNIAVKIQTITLPAIPQKTNLSQLRTQAFPSPPKPKDLLPPLTLKSITFPPTSKENPPINPKRKLKILTIKIDSPEDDMDEINKHQSTLQETIKSAQQENQLLQKTSGKKGLYGVAYDGYSTLISIMPHFRSKPMFTQQSANSPNIKQERQQLACSLKWKIMAELADQLVSLSNKLNDESSLYSHGDIKPDNIIFDDTTYSAHFVDYGSASRVGTTNQRLGTLHYMAPETLTEGETHSKSDIFPLAAVYASFLGIENPSEKRKGLRLVELADASNNSLGLNIKGDYHLTELPKSLGHRELSKEVMSKTIELFLSRMASIQSENRPDAIEVSLFCRKMQHFFDTIELLTNIEALKEKYLITDLEDISINDILIAQGIYKEDDQLGYKINQERYQKLPKELKIELLKSYAFKYKTARSNFLITFLRRQIPVLQKLSKINIETLDETLEKQDPNELTKLLNNTEIMSTVYRDYVDSYKNNLTREISAAGGTKKYLKHRLEDSQIISLEARQLSLGNPSGTELKFSKDYNDNRRRLITKAKLMGSQKEEDPIKAKPSLPPISRRT